MKTLLFGLMMLNVSIAHALSCNSGDAIWSSNSRTEYQSCTGYGYCSMYDYNPATGKYEYFYGYHSNCSGTKERWVQEYTCKRASDGSLYTVRDEGFWGGCNIR